ncbi:hypothetical protein [Paenibacillus amylolyticus]|uniref:hypothetical protein n=1 Tax=Paenibacillus amylolyticus TaxID=1451 RepID=UPI00249C4AE1|nr:hypothetical protein [Paenibacillus amylolyticus]WFA88046.1 hypothetical protein OGI70_14500 [Paenibacillus amylolyticus]
MRRLDYLLKTSRGNLDRYMARYARRLSFLINQEPYSKNSMSLAEQLRFQQEISDYLEKSKRRAFKGPVILKMDFFPSKGNPPSIHQLAKNYLDLLWRPVQGMVNPRLLLIDDRQISILIVNYHVQTENPTPRIEIKIAPMRDFVDDIRLVEKIRSKISFPEDEHYLSYDEREVFSSELKDPIKELEKSRESLIVTRSLKGDIDVSLFDKLYEMSMRDYQSAFFLMEKFKSTDLIGLYLDQDYLTDEFLGHIFEQYRKMIITYSLQPLRTAGLPIRSGETRQFKDTIRDMIQQFRDKYPVLIPLLINLNLTILYVPPKVQEIDLDNLARYIVPLINEALKPPSGIWFSGYQHPIGFPKHTIIQYQIIKIPRSNNDPENGSVKLVFGEYSPYKDCWSDFDDVIDRWSDAIF